jgi:hypothetical protein
MVFDYSLVALGLLATFRAVESRALLTGLHRPTWPRVDICATS